MEDNHKYFCPPEDPDNPDYRFDVGNDHELVDDVDAQTLIRLVKFLRRSTYARHHHFIVPPSRMAVYLCLMAVYLMEMSYPSNVSET